MITGSYYGTLQHEQISPHLEGHTTGQVRSVSFSPDGTTLASLGWNFTNSICGMLQRRTNIAIIENMGSRSVSFSPDGMTLASPGAYNDFSDYRSCGTWRQENRLPPLRDQWTNSGEIIGHTNQDLLLCRFHLAGQPSLPRQLDKTVQLWNVATREHIAIFSGHTSGVTSVAFSPDGTMLASASLDNKIKLWDTSEWAEGSKAQALDRFQRRRPDGLRRLLPLRRRVRRHGPSL